MKSLEACARIACINNLLAFGKAPQVKEEFKYDSLDLREIKPRFLEYVSRAWEHKTGERLFIVNLAPGECYGGNWVSTDYSSLKRRNEEVLKTIGHIPTFYVSETGLIKIIKEIAPPYLERISKVKGADDRVKLEIHPLTNFGR